MFEKQLKTDVTQFKKLSLKMSIAAHNARIELLSSDFTSIEKKHIEVYIACILEYYQKLAFFSDEEIKTKFKELGFKKKELVWFTDFQTLMNELVNIENTDKVIVFPYHAISITSIYVELKITRTVFDWALRTYGKNYLNIFKKFLKQKRYHDTLNKNSSPRHPLNSKYEEVLEYTKDKNFIDDFFLKSNKGKVDSILIPLLLEAGFYPKKSTGNSNGLLTEHEFLWTLFPFIKQIMKEKNFMSDDDFIQLKKKKGDDYRLYIIRLIKKIGKRTHPFKDYTQID